MKYHKVGGVNNRNLFSVTSGGRKSKIQVLVGLVPPEACFLGM